MKMNRIASALALLIVGLITESSAQILYTQLISNAPQFQLRQVNGDGSGDTAIGLPFASVSYPTWSRDAALFAISAPNPNRPNEHSYNVYAINPVTGAIQQITLFQDLSADPQTGTFRWNLPYYKAFSPDRSAMAVSSFIVQGSRGTTSQVTPVLEVYSTATPVNPLLVHVHSNRANSHHAGEGVDWHPSQNVLVTPVESSAPLQSGGSGSGQVTALFLLDPVDGAIQRGRFRQITFPRADVSADFTFRWGEHDYQPKFSPNGVGVAYVRSFQNLSLTRGGYDPNIQSLRILNLNTGADTEVLRLQPGGYVNSLDWSPDGTALVFSLGQQRNGVNGLEQDNLPETNEIYVVNVNGTGVRRLRGAGAASPAWRPLTAAGQTPTGNNVVVQSPSGDAFVIFPAVSQAGTSTFAPINPASAGALPAGYTILNNAPAYDITTTAAFTPPVAVCHTISAIASEAEFARARILHGENGQLVDRTILSPDALAPDFATRKVCARVNSLSPFVTALAPAAPTPTPTPSTSTVQLSQSTYHISEGSGFASITVTRTGDTASALAVNYSTLDAAGLASCTQLNGQASERCDYSTTLGTLRWAAGEGANKTFTIPVVDDRHQEGDEVLTVALSNPLGATISGAQSTATVIISDNGNDTGTSNPIDEHGFFINQQYLDFLGRLPDGGGFANWMATLGACPGGGYGTQNPDCDRIKIAMSTFQSAEFQSRGYWAYRFYEVAFGRRPSYSEFIPDMAQVGGPKSPQEEALAKDQYMNEFVLRGAFVNGYAATVNNPTAYVDTLLQTAGLANHPLRATLMAQLQGGQKTRAQVLREIVESKEVEDRFYIRGFVSMMYYGFLRRDPDQTGFQNYVNQLNQTWDPRKVTFDFIYSAEYMGRFGKP
jgi:hypothetical protein